MRTAGCMLSMFGLAVTVMGASIPSARATSEEEAREHFVRGREQYDRGKYGQAIRSFKKAMQIRPSPLLDYNIGRCHEKLGQPGPAIEAYERYLRTLPKAANRRAVQDRIARLKPPPASAPTESQPPASAPAELQQPASAPVDPLSSPASQPAPDSRLSRHEAEGQPPAGQTAGSAESRHEAEMTSGDPRRPSRDPVPQQHRDERPLYKQWWFWVGCAGGALIVGFIIATASSDQHTSPQSGASAGGLRLSF